MKKKVKKSQHIHILLTEKEYKNIHNKAETLNISMSEFVRRATFRREIPSPIPKINLNTYHQLCQIKLELTRIGINLCQITHDFHNSFKINKIPNINSEEIQLNLQNLKQANANIAQIASVITNRHLQKLD